MLNIVILRLSTDLSTTRARKWFISLLCILHDRYSKFISEYNVRNDSFDDIDNLSSDSASNLLMYSSVHHKPPKYSPMSFLEGKDYENLLLKVDLLFATIITKWQRSWGNFMSRSQRSLMPWQQCASERVYAVDRIWVVEIHIKNNSLVWMLSATLRNFVLLILPTTSEARQFQKFFPRW